MEKYIGLDLGTTTLGIATSDILGFVHGLETFKFAKDSYSKARERVHQIVSSTGIKNIVIGPRCIHIQNIKVYIQNLTKHIMQKEIFFSNFCKS